MGYPLRVTKPMREGTPMLMRLPEAIIAGI